MNNIYIPTHSVVVVNKFFKHLSINIFTCLSIDLTKSISRSMKEVDVITIFIHRNYIMVEDIAQHWIYFQNQLEKEEQY